MVCVDNSEYTRNGDYAPTRFQAQADAVNLLAGAKTQHHPENTVGVMTMAGKTPQVGRQQGPVVLSMSVFGRFMCKSNICRLTQERKSASIVVLSELDRMPWCSATDFLECLGTPTHIVCLACRSPRRSACNNTCRCWSRPRPTWARC